MPKVFGKWTDRKKSVSELDILITDNVDMATVAGSSRELYDIIILVSHKTEVKVDSNIIVCLPCDFASTLRDALWNKSEPETAR